MQTFLLNVCSDVSTLSEAWIGIEKLDWCDVEKSRRRDPWSLNPPCNPIPQCRGNVDGRAPDTRDWRKNLLYYKNDVAALGGGLLVFIIVIIVVLCFCLKKKDNGPKGSKPIVDDMMNVGVGTAVVDLDVHCKHWRKVSIRLLVSNYSIQRWASPSVFYH
ncbi:unnamed protein product, partial [Mesorhabditis spiculigera]